MVRRRDVGRGRSMTKVLILVIAWVTGCRDRYTEGTGRTDGRGLQDTGGADARGRHGKEMVVDRRGASMEQGTSEETRRVKK